MFSACKKEDDSDPCDAVNCLNGGTCNDGSCDCPTGFIGAWCNIMDLHVSIIVTSITVSNYPLTNNGLAWDVPPIGTSTPPDITWAFIRPTNDVIFGEIYLNADGSDLSFTSSSAGLPFTIPMAHVNELNSIIIWDIDGLDASDNQSTEDFMGGYTWEPESFIDNLSNAFPSTLVIGNEGQLQFSLEVTYDWHY